jgi:hypothetical protein
VAATIWQSCFHRWHKQAQTGVIAPPSHHQPHDSERAIGSVEVPITDQQLEANFTDLAAGILPRQETSRLIELCWIVEQLTSVADVAKAAVPA